MKYINEKTAPYRNPTITTHPDRGVAKSPFYAVDCNIPHLEKGGI